MYSTADAGTLQPSWLADQYRGSSGLRAQPRLPEHVARSSPAAEDRRLLTPRPGYRFFLSEDPDLVGVCEEERPRIRRSRRRSHGAHRRQGCEAEAQSAEAGSRLVTGTEAVGRRRGARRGGRDQLPCFARGLRRGSGKEMRSSSGPRIWICFAGASAEALARVRRTDLFLEKLIWLGAARGDPGAL